MAEKKRTDKDVQDVQETRYTREALAGSAKYRPFCDVLMILLEEGKEYTFAEADAVIEKFKGRPVVETTVGKE